MVNNNPVSSKRVMMINKVITKVVVMETEIVTNSNKFNKKLLNRLLISHSPSKNT